MPKGVRRTPGAPEVVDVLAARTHQTEVAPEPLAVEELPPIPPPVPMRPVPESQLNPEQRRIRDLENQLALERGKKEPEIELAEPTRPGANENILIHFLEDGFTALGQIWRRGQELEFEPNSPAYQDTVDRFGWSWLELRLDEFQQVDRYGKVMFRVGPWPGKTYAEVAKLATFEPLKSLKEGTSPPQAPTEEELQAAERAELKRRRAAPRLPMR